MYCYAYSLEVTLRCKTGLCSTHQHSSRATDTDRPQEQINGPEHQDHNTQEMQSLQISNMDPSFTESERVNSHEKDSDHNLAMKLDF